MPSKKERQPDQKRIVASLASEFHVPVAEMATLYQHERAALALGAHITKYLDIFTTRNVQENLRQRDLDQQTPVPQEAASAAASSQPLCQANDSCEPVQEKSPC